MLGELFDLKCVLCSTKRVKTDDVVAVLGSTKALRELWNPPLTRSAISHWKGEVPKLRVYQIREKRPDIDARIAALPRAPVEEQSVREVST